MFVIQDVLLAASITVKIGDAVIINTAAPQSATNAAGGTGIILGTVRAIKNGSAAGNVFLQESSVTTGASNLTVGKISVDVLSPDAPTTYTADLDDVAGTTTNSQYFGYFNLSATDSALLDESTYSASVEKQFLSYGVNPGNSSQVIGVWTKIAQS